MEPLTASSAVHDDSHDSVYYQKTDEFFVCTSEKAAAKFILHPVHISVVPTPPLDLTKVPYLALSRVKFKHKPMSAAIASSEEDPFLGMDGLVTVFKYVDTHLGERLWSGLSFLRTAAFVEPFVAAPSLGPSQKGSLKFSNIAMEIE